ncbi:MAG TPA: TIGR00299 family protein, partial [Acidimicrobiaceae bacterium]|nr:TIGR00299 family protein [Acidimicrobiaceae bacterium]
AEVARVLTTETGSLGVRGHAVERWSVARSFETVDLDGHQVGVKVSTGRVKVEHDDAARVAAATGLPLREVVARAEAVWRDSQPE